MKEDVVRDAIISKRSVTALSAQGPLRFSPHALGREADGTAVVIGFQYAGVREGGLPDGGDWCCLRLGDLSQVEANDDDWITGADQPPRDHLESIDVWTF